MLNLSMDAKVQIGGLLYDQYPGDDVKFGDRVLDMEDGMHGTCDFRSGDYIAIRDNCTVQMRVPVSRIRILRLPDPQKG